MILRTMSSYRVFADDTLKDAEKTESAFTPSAEGGGCGSQF
jgi:hypothetical protein